MTAARPFLWVRGPDPSSGADHERRVERRDTAFYVRWCHGASMLRSLRCYYVATLVLICIDHTHACTLCILA